MNNQEKLTRDAYMNILKRYLSSADSSFRKGDIIDCDKFLRLAVAITNNLI